MNPFKSKNLYIDIIEVLADKSLNVESYVKRIFESQGYKMVKTNGSPKGIPDFICTRGVEKYYIEVKSENDALRVSQIEWINNNPCFPTIILVIKRISKEPKKQKSIEDGYCGVCKGFYISDELTIEGKKILCFTCLRKNLFIKFFEKRFGILPEEKRKEIDNIKGEFNINDLLEIVADNYAEINKVLGYT